MPRPEETPEVKQSKALAYILRHGAEKEGLQIRSDGLIRLDDVLARPRVKNLAVDQDTVFRLVEDNAKKRFELVYGFDPSPPKPKKKQQPKKKKTPRAVPDAPVPVDATSDGLAQISIADNADPEWVELEFVKLSPPGQEDVAAGSEGAWFIRAVQGHSIKLAGTDHLEALKDDEEGRAKAGVLVHGTQWRLWETLKEQGLSRMNRQHVHLAPALSGHRILPRPNSTLQIFLDFGKMLAAQPPIPVFAAANGVLLTPGNSAGFVPKEYWSKAVHIEKGQRLVVWENGEPAQRVE